MESNFMTRDGCFEAFIEQKKRADALESQLAEANAGLKNLSKRLCANHAATMCGDRYLRNDGKCEICEANAELLATRWRPITAEDLPMYRDEVGRIRASQALRQEWEVQAVKCTKGWIHWADSGWTHFRAISPPERKEQP